LLAKNEEERMHIHVICGGHEAKYWLEPRVELAKDTGIPEIKKIVEKYADSFKEQFRQHIGKRIDD
jgi:dissimilatory sulfite reductase (desulfoviridin) alpha/beta subunit